jgi:hypothetical protein
MMFTPVSARGVGYRSKWNADRDEERALPRTSKIKRSRDGGIWKELGCIDAEVARARAMIARLSVERDRLKLCKVIMKRSKTESCILEKSKNVPSCNCFYIRT